MDILLISIKKSGWFLNPGSKLDIHAEKTHRTRRLQQGCTVLVGFFVPLVFIELVVNLKDISILKDGIQG